MGLETNVSTIHDLDADWPLDSDPRAQGAAHIRTIKAAVQNTFPHITKPIDVTDTKLNAVLGVFGDSGVFQPSAAFTIPGGSSVSGALSTGGLSITGPAGSGRQITFATDSKGKRFSLLVGSGTEGGSNTGSDFFLSRFDDAGTWIDDPIYISRSTGTATFSQRPFLNGAVDWNTYQAVTAKDVSLNYVSGTSSGGNVAVTNIQMVGAPNGDNPNAYLQIGTGKYALAVPTNGNVSTQITNYAQPKGNYAQSQALTDTAAYLQSQINGKQPSGNYVSTSGNQGGTGDQKIVGAYFSVAVNCPWMIGYGQDGGTHQYLLAQLNDLQLDRSKKLQCFQTVIQSGQRVNFPSGFSSSPDSINLTPTQRVDLWYTAQDSGGFTVNSNVGGAQTISVTASGSK